MDDPSHLQILRGGVQSWNEWRAENPDKMPQLRAADLRGSRLGGADLSRAQLTESNLADTDFVGDTGEWSFDGNDPPLTSLRHAELSGANLSGANLMGIDLAYARLEGANLCEAELSLAQFPSANLRGADLTGARMVNTEFVGANLTEATIETTTLGGSNLRGANLTRADLIETNLRSTDFRRADLSEAKLWDASLVNANLEEAILRGAELMRANFTDANLRAADLTGADLTEADLIRTQVTGATFTKCRAYGMSVWDAKGSPGDESEIVITPKGQATVTVDSVRVAQFVYLLLSNPNIRDVIDTVGEKGVLVLGRFGERKRVLDKVRARLRKFGFAPMVFDFEKPVSEDFTDTVRTLAGMSAFIVADITAPRSVPQEAQAIIPDYMVPFVPIIQQGEKPWATFKDLWIKYRDWVFEPLEYPSIDQLIPKLGGAVVKPALERRKELLARRAEEMGTRSLDDIRLDEE